MSVKFIIWVLVLISILGFIYYSILKGGITGLIDRVVSTFAHQIQVIVISIIISWIIAFFDGYSWFNVDCLGFGGIFFLWFGLVAGVIISIFIVFWNLIVDFLVFVIKLPIYLLSCIFGFSFGKMKVYKIKGGSYKNTRFIGEGTSKRKPIRC